MPIFSKEIILRSLAPFGLVSNEGELALCPKVSVPRSSSPGLVKSSGGPWARKSIKSRVDLDTTGDLVGGDGTGGTAGISSLSEPAMISSKSIDSRFVCRLRVRGGNPGGSSDRMSRAMVWGKEVGIGGGCLRLERLLTPGVERERVRLLTPGFVGGTTNSCCMGRVLSGGWGKASSSSSKMELTARRDWVLEEMESVDLLKEMGAGRLDFLSLSCLCTYSKCYLAAD